MAGGNFIIARTGSRHGESYARMEMGSYYGFTFQRNEAHRFETEQEAENVMEELNRKSTAEYLVKYSLRVEQIEG